MQQNSRLKTTKTIAVKVWNGGSAVGGVSSRASSEKSASSVHRRISPSTGFSASTLRQDSRSDPSLLLRPPSPLARADMSAK